ncbi:electron transfer flavoprotein subunit beta/FixA family protein [Cumulibacter soli]|uniref:electron transfer flavoprotein subunit beta/FixA family protein n=1 Tax=Cumulibacter soli TaxID=2546344 RepID=UPI00106868D7|nr:electron transfer flavoprotein subunit beta/FixA family protein [Cumulibacter soli]
MKIVVLAKQVPDSGNPRTLNESDKTVDRANADLVLNEMDEYAIEEALKMKEAFDGEVTVLSVGPASATDTVRKALQMGADKGVLVTDDAIAGSDAVGTAKVLAAALGKLEWDLVLAGAESTDGRVSAMPALLAELTGATQLTGARSIGIDDDTVTIERQIDGGFEVVQGQMPAIISVWDTINEPRYPSFKGIMAAKKKPIDELTLADVGVDASEVGLSNSWTQVVDASPRPPRQAGEKVDDEGDGGQKLVAYLVSQKLV